MSFFKFIFLSLQWHSEQDYHRVEALLKKANLPTQAPDNMNAEEFMQHMSIDKKVRAGKLYLVLLQAIGDAILTADYNPKLLEQTLSECCDT